jgi:hypothetical protein
MRKKKTGYCSPPVHTQFQKGQSGNPKGRPKRAKGEQDMASLLTQELNARITIQENGKSMVVSKQEALVKRVVNSALNGDQRAFTQLMKSLAHASARKPVDHPQGGVLLIPYPPDTEEEWERRAQKSMRRIEENKRMLDGD